MIEVTVGWFAYKLLPFCCLFSKVENIHRSFSMTMFTC